MPRHLFLFERIAAGGWIIDNRPGCMDLYRPFPTPSPAPETRAEFSAPTLKTDSSFEPSSMLTRRPTSVPTRSHPRKATALILALLGAFALGASSDQRDWTLVSGSKDVTLYERSRAGSSLREVKGVGMIQAPPAVVRRVLEDVESYPHFMPYCVESKVISKDAATRVSYQRLSPPMVGERDYTVRVCIEMRPSASGTPCYFSHWQAANDLGPAEKAGVARVKVAEGSWLLEAADDGRQTHATYCLYTDSGGGIPAMILNLATRTSVPKLFESIRKQAMLAKYSVAQQ